MRFLYSKILFLCLLVSSLYGQSNWYLIGGFSGDPSDFFQTNPSVELIWGVEDREWKWAASPAWITSASISDTAALSSFSNLESIVANHGYWISSSQSVVSTVSRESSIPVTLLPGYHLIAGNNESTQNFLANHPEVDMIWSYVDPQPDSFLTAGEGLLRIDKPWHGAFPRENLRDFRVPMLSTLETGRAYWLISDRTGVSLELKKGGSARERHSSSLVDGGIYHFGGFSGARTLDLLEIYHIPSDEWSTGASSGTPRRDHSSSVYEDRIYIFGGRGDEEGLLSTLQVYDPTSDSWQNLQSAPVGRRSHCAFLYEDSLYVWGGYSEQSSGTVTNSLDQYLFAEDRWISSIRGGTARARHSCAVIGSQVYMIGGTTQSVDRLDLESGIWSKVSDLESHFSRGDARVYQKDILLAGGVDLAFQSESSVRSITTAGSRIEILGDLITPRQLHTSLVYQGKLFSYGGRDRKSEILSSIEVFLLDGLNEKSVNQAPVVTNFRIEGNSGEVRLLFDLYEHDGDPWVDLNPQYSLDQGMSWNEPVGLTGFRNAVQAGIGKELTWDTSQDFSLDQTGVEIRIFATDGRDSFLSQALDSISFWNGIPKVEDIIVEGKSAEVEISFLLIDPDQDLVDVEVEFSINEGLSWSPITSGSLRSLSSSSSTSDPGAGLHSLSWDTQADIADERLRVLLRITPDDGLPRQAPSTKSSIFPIFNGPNQPAQIRSVSLDGSSELIMMDISAIDLDGDLVQIKVEYSTDSGTSWNQATLRSGEEAEFNPGEVISLGWDSNLDFDQDLEGVLLRIWAEDGKLGDPEPFFPPPISVYNANFPAVVKDLQVQEADEGILELSALLDDMDGDRLDLRLWYRTSSLLDWVPIAPFHFEGERMGISSSSSVQLTWYPSLSTEERLGNLEIKLTVDDSKEAVSETTSIALVTPIGGQWKSGGSSSAPRARHLGRVEKANIVYMGGENNRLGFLDQPELYTPFSQIFASLPVAFPQRVDMAGEVIEGIFYLWGGRSDSLSRISTNEMILYDVANREVQRSLFMREPRWGHRSALHGGDIYFSGGISLQEEILDELLVFDQATLNFSEGPSMNTARVGHCSVVIDDQLVVWGGATGSGSKVQVSTTVEILDIDTGKWRFGTPSPRPGLFSSCTAASGKLYSVGGLLDENEIDLSFPDEVLIYDLRTDSWIKADPPNTRRSSASLQNFQGDFYFFGGYQSTTNTYSSMEIYSPPSIPAQALQTPSRVENLELLGSSEEIVLVFDIVDKPGSLLDLWVELSLDQGLSWSRLGEDSLLGSLESLSPATGVSLVWNSALDISTDLNDLKLRISAVNIVSGLLIPGISTSFSIFNNPSNSPPQITDLKIQGDADKIRDLVEISFTLSDDNEGDLSSISLEYSTNSGLHWISTENISGDLRDLSSGTSKILTWDSMLDISSTFESVLIRLTPDDGKRGSASPTQSSTFSLYNGNFLPYAQMVFPLGSEDDIEVQFELVDQDGDLLEVRLEYSLDGQVWFSSDELSGSTSGLAAVTHSLVWHSLRDIQRNEESVRVRIIPSDLRGEGFHGLSQPFAVQNENYTGLIAIRRPRQSHSANIYDNRIFYWGGVNERGEILNSLDIFDLNTFTWSKGTSGGTPRREHAGIANSGKLYFWGGKDSSDSLLNTLDVYDINADTWTQEGFGGRARSGHSAVVFEDKIYYWGGKGISGETNSMDVYDLIQGEWSQGISGGAPRSDHSGVRVGDLFINWGGVSQQSILDRVDIYQFRSGEWSTGIAGGTERYGHTAVEHEGKIYIWGGFKEGSLDTLDIYDPGLALWSEGDQGGTARSQHTAVVHQDQIYYYGGIADGEVLSRHEVYSIPSSSVLSSNADLDSVGWIPISLGLSGRTSHAGLEDNGDIYHYFGFDSSTAPLSNLESLDAQTLSVAPNESLSMSKTHFAYHAHDGKHYFFGGQDSEGITTDSVLIFHTSDKILSKGPSGGVRRYGHMAGSHKENLYLFGGRDHLGNLSTDLDIFHWNSQNWFQSRGGGTARVFGSAESIDGRIYFWGGEDSSGSLTNSLEIYDAQAGVFLEGSPGGIPRKHHSSFAMDGNIYFWGGLDSSGNALDNIDVYSIEGDLWSSGPSGGIPRHSATLTRTSRKAIAFGGQDSSGNVLADAYEFTPVVNSGVSWKEGVSGGSSRALHTAVEFQERLFQWGGINSSGGMDQTDIYDLRTGKWSVGSSGGRTRWDHSAVLHDGSVYYFGGKGDGGALSTLDIHHLPGRELGWIDGPSGPGGRQGSVAEAFQDQLYFFGGRVEDGTLPETLEIFSTISNQWQTPLTPSGGFLGREYSSSVLYGSSMLIYGGETALGISDELLELSLVEMSIEAAPSPDSQIGPRYQHQAVFHDRQMYVLGGRNASDTYLSTIGSYDVKAGWSVLPVSFSTGIANTSALLYGNRIYIYGGNTQGGTVDTLRILDLDSLSITLGPSSSNPRAAHSGALVGSLMYFWGGQNESGPVRGMDIFDLSTQTWIDGLEEAPDMIHAAQATNSKRIYSWSGENNGVIESGLSVLLPQAMNINLEAGVFSQEPAGGTSRVLAGGTTYNERLYFHGGADGSGVATDVLEIYEPATGDWSSGPSSIHSRLGHSMDSANELIFVWGGMDENGVELNELEIYDPQDQTWSRAPSGGTSRVHHASIQVGNSIYYWGGSDGNDLLNSMDIYTVDPWFEGPSGGVARTAHGGVGYQGKIYFWGGQNSSGTVLDSLDIYDPQANSWTSGTPGGTRRFSHTSVVLEDRVYYWGGLGINSTTENMNIVDVYDFTINGWISGTAGGRVRYDHSASVATGLIYFWGGKDSSDTVTNTLDIYDKDATISFSSGVAGGTARFDHSATVYEDKIYFFGGRISNISRLRTMDIYDTSTATWSSAQIGPTERSGHSAALVDGKIYFVGGTNLSGRLSSVDIYDIAQDEWLTGPEAPAGRSDHSSVLVSDVLYVWGGRNSQERVLDTLEIYQVNQWGRGTTGGTPRSHVSVSDSGGKLFFWGGDDQAGGGNTVNNLDIYEISSDSWRVGLAGGGRRKSHVSLESDGKIYFYGGVEEDNGEVLNTLDIYDISSTSWSRGFAGGSGREGHVGLKLDSTIYFWGGIDGNGELQNTLDGFAPSSVSSLEWETGNDGPDARYGHSANLYHGKLYIYGGKDTADNPLDTLLSLDLGTGNWSSLGQGLNSRWHHAAALWKDKIYFWGGEDASGAITNTLDVYDLDTGIWESLTSGGTPREGHFGSAFDGNLFFWGGRDVSGSLNLLDIYNIQSDTWTSGVAGGRSRIYHSAVERDGLVYAHGGQGSGELFFDSIDILDLRVQKNTAPVLSNLSLKEVSILGYLDQVEFKVDLSDSDDDFVALGVEYSIDRGNTWFQIDPTHLEGELQSLVETEAHSIIWNSYSDIVENRNQVQIRISASDGQDRSLSLESQPFLLSNSGTWVSGSRSPSPRSNHTLSFFSSGTGSDFLIAWGGYDSRREITNTLEIYDLNAGVWSTGTPGPTEGAGRVNHDVITFGNKLYHYGGRDATGPLNTFAVVEFSSFGTPSWKHLEGVAGGIPRSSHTCSLVDGKMYVWGGLGTTGMVRQMDIYDLNKESWSQGNADGLSRYGHLGIVVGSQIYYYGGRGEDSDGDGSDDFLDSLEIYNTVNDSWSRGASPGVGLESAAAALVDDRLFIYGGNEKNDPFKNHLYIYNILSDSWQTGQTGGVGRRNLRGSAHNRNLYFHGGFHGDELDQLDIFKIPKP